MVEIGNDDGDFNECVYRQVVMTFICYVTVELANICDCR